MNVLIRLPERDAARLGESWPSRLQDAADIEALEEIRRLRRAE